MAITTVDTVTNVVSGNEAIRNGTFVTTCSVTGRYDTISLSTDTNYVSFDTSLTYNQIENLYTNRFDDITYYNAVDGGSP
jgi:hypothetical protein